MLKLWSRAGKCYKYVHPTTVLSWLKQFKLVIILILLPYIISPKLNTYCTYIISKKTKIRIFVQTLQAKCGI